MVKIPPSQSIASAYAPIYSEREILIMNPKAAKTVDAYLAGLPPSERKILENLRKAIKSAAPQSEERISYQIPAYFYKGPLIFFARQSRFLSLYVPGRSVWKKFKEELKQFEIKGNTIHFSAERPLPSGFVKNIVRERMRENEERKA